MKMRWSNRPASLILCCIFLLTIGCAAQPPRSTALSKPANLAFAIPSAYREYYQKQLDAFKTVEPNITIQLKDENTQTADVREIGWLESRLAESDPLNAALDLSPFIQQESGFDREDFYPGLLEAFSREGKLLAIPTGLNPFVLYYNQNLFDQYAIPYPGDTMTWDEFKTTAMRLRDPIAGIYGYLPVPNYQDAIFFAYQHGAALMDGQTPRLDSPESIEALEWYATLFTSIGAAPTADQVRLDFGNRGIFAAIEAGKGAMWIDEFVSLGRFTDSRIPYKVGIAPLPQNKMRFSVALFNGLVISSSSENPEAAWQWVRFLSGQLRPGSIPARRSVAESSAFNQAVGEANARIARDVVENARLISSFDPQRLMPVMESYLTAVARTVDGMLPAADTLREAQQSIQP